MKFISRFRFLFLWALLATAALSTGGARAWAQCSGGSVSITRPGGGASGLAGNIRIDLTTSTPPSSSGWDSVSVSIYDGSGNLVEQGQASYVSLTQYTYAWPSSLQANGSYQIQASVFQGDCEYDANPVSVTIQNPCSTRHASAAKLQNCFPRHNVGTMGTTSPATGDQSFTIPITSWQFHGATYDFSLYYNSVSLADPQAADTHLPDPQAPVVPHFAGLSEGNTKWSHSYAQWIDLWQDPSGNQYAVWHSGGRALAFPKSGTAFVSPDSYLTLSYVGGSIGCSFPWNGGSGSLSVPYSSFILKDAQRTEYDFNTVYWRTAEGTALPHYLLTRIQDRLGRVLNINWGGGGDEPHVTSVLDAGGTGITLGYSNNLLTSVTDPQGRTHSLSYTQYVEVWTNRQKLTGITVYGPGSPNRTTANWSFVYLTPGYPGQGYNGSSSTGSFTGDLVIQRTAPDGIVTNYNYEAICGTRPREEDWDGRLYNLTYTNGADGGTITRGGSDPSSAQLSFPGGRSFQYSYSNGDLTATTDVANGRVWSATYDAKHNRLTTRSPLEQSTPNPLAQNDYLFDSSGHITQVTRRVRQSDGSLGDPIETQFNAFNLPTQVKAYARAGSGNPDAITQYQYDGGGTLTAGKLTKVIAACGTSVQQETNLFYNGSNGAWGLVTGVQNAVGATSSFDYDTNRGWLLSSSSPQNLVVPSTHPDYTASVTTRSYNGDGLPSVLTDALGHQIGVSYCAAAAGSANLVVTYSFVDGSTRQVTIDPMGRVLQQQDERGVVTQWTYNSLGQTTSVRRAAGTSDETLTVNYYSSQGDLAAFDPPNGSSGRVTFEYGRYNQDGSYDGTYEGRVTRIAYPDGTSQYFGYNAAGEQAWLRKPDGSLVTITRDARHRPVTTTYPAAPGGSAFSVTKTLDEFGRVTSSTDATGATTVTYDALNRRTAVTPPSPRKAVAYSYTKDTTLQRWITSVSAMRPTTLWGGRIRVGSAAAMTTRS